MIRPSYNPVGSGKLNTEIERIAEVMKVYYAMSK